MTSAASASCGTAFGLTKLVTSITGRPAAVSASTNAILTLVGIEDGLVLQTVTRADFDDDDVALRREPRRRVRCSLLRLAVGWRERDDSPFAASGRSLVRAVILPAVAERRRRRSGAHRHRRPGWSRRAGRSRRARRPRRARWPRRTRRRTGVLVGGTGVSWAERACSSVAQECSSAEPGYSSAAQECSSAAPVSPSVEPECSLEAPACWLAGLGSSSAGLELPSVGQACCRRNRRVRRRHRCARRRNWCVGGRHRRAGRRHRRAASEALAYGWRDWVSSAVALPAVGRRCVGGTGVLVGGTGVFVGGTGVFVAAPACWSEARECSSVARACSSADWRAGRHRRGSSAERRSTRRRGDASRVAMVPSRRCDARSELHAAVAAATGVAAPQSASPLAATGVAAPMRRCASVTGVAPGDRCCRSSAVDVLGESLRSASRLGGRLFGGCRLARPQALRSPPPLRSAWAAALRRRRRRGSRSRRRRPQAAAAGDGSSEDLAWLSLFVDDGRTFPDPPKTCQRSLHRGAIVRPC